MRFVPTTTGTTNAVSGAGTFTANGKFLLDLAGADTTAGNEWLLVDVDNLTATFGAGFTVDSSLGAFTETAGVWEFTDTGAGKKWTFTESTGKLSVADVAGSDYDTWIAGPTGYFPGETNVAIIGSTADPDGDGLTNQEEYAFGLAPNSGTSVNPITQQLDKSTGVFKYSRRNTTAFSTGVTYTYEYSTTLSGAWNPLILAGPESSDNGNPTEVITLTVDPSLRTNPKLFVRVKALK